MLARGGMAVQVGVIPPGQKITIDGLALLADRHVRGSQMGDNRFRIDIPRYLDFWRRGRLQIDRMVTRRAPLEGINEAFRAMKAGEVVRTVLVLDPTAVTSPT
jgi:S-(hydroxymethyl)glutathione dehydrogenase/alcohol dehydrogenase